MISEGMCQLIWTGYFLWISYDAFYFVYFCVGLSAIAGILSFYLVESPRYLFGVEKYDECRAVLVKIAERNGVTDYQPCKFEEEMYIMVEETDLRVSGSTLPGRPTTK